MGKKIAFNLPLEQQDSSYVYGEQSEMPLDLQQVIAIVHLQYLPQGLVVGWNVLRGERVDLGDLGDLGDWGDWDLGDLEDWDLED